MKGDVMFNKLSKLVKNSTFLFFMNIVFAETVVTATFVYFNQVPSEAILSTNLTEILLVFEG
jgi:hypothetical protein